MLISRDNSVIMDVLKRRIDMILPKSTTRAISYKKLLHKMVDMDISMKEIRLRYSSNTATKIRNSQPVNLAILVDICEWLDCELEDIVAIEHIKPVEDDNKKYIDYRGL